MKLSVVDYSGTLDGSFRSLAIGLLAKYPKDKSLTLGVQI